MQNHYSRRDALRFALSGLAAGGLAAQLGSAAHAGRLLPSAAGAKKALFVFLRGGNDGCNTVIPDGDPAYHVLRQTTSGGIGIDTASSLDLMNGFARLHPAMINLMPAFNAGHLACIHRVHYAGASQSHFTSQQSVETANPNQLDFVEGFLPRLLSITHPGLLYRGASVSQRIQRMFGTDQADRALAHVQEIATYSFARDRANPTPQELKLRGDSTPPNGTGLSGHFGGPAIAWKNDAFLRTTGEMLLESEAQIRPLADAASYVPEGGAVYPLSSFGTQLADSINLLKNTDCQVAGVELGGFDNHSGQGGAAGAHAGRLAELANGLRAIYDDSTASASIGDLLTIVITEFGRTARMNSSGGTDHGWASAMFAMGTGVRGDVYNCDAASWSPGDITSKAGKYTDHLTDFRIVLAEALVRHFGLSPSSPEIDFVLPNVSAYAGTPEFTPLNYLR